MISGGRLCQSCSVLQNDSSRDFQHSKQCKYKEKYLSKFSKAHKRKQTSLLAKVNSRCFFPFFRPPSMLVPFYASPWQSSINLCGILYQITRVRKTVQTWDLDRVHIYLSSISWLYSLNGFWFLFWWRDSENWQLFGFVRSTYDPWYRLGFPLIKSKHRKSG